MQSTNSEYGSPYLVVCHVIFSENISWISSIINNVTNNNQQYFVKEKIL